MDLNEILLSGVTLVVTWVLGYFSKKSKFVSNNIIPIQNVLVGLIMAGIDWLITKDFKVSIALSGLVAGGSYDIIHNLSKIKLEKQTLEVVDEEESELLEDRDDE